MIETSTIVGLYVAGVLEITIPLFALYFLYRRHRYSISSLFFGILIYFASTKVLIPGITSLIGAFPGALEYLESQFYLLVLILSVITALFQLPIQYLAVRFTRKGKCTIYDTLAMGLAYWLPAIFSNSATMISQGSLSRTVNSGKIEELVTETITIDQVEGLVQQIRSLNFFTVQVQMITQLFMVVINVALVLLVYHSVKRKKIWVLYVGIGINIAYLISVNYVEKWLGYWPSNAVFLIIAAGAVYFIARYMKWYKIQQAQLLQKKKEYKERQRAKAAANMKAKEEAKRLAEEQKCAAAQSETPQAPSSTPED